MKQKDFKGKVEISEGVETKLDGNALTLKGEKGEVTKIFKMPVFQLSQEGNNVIVFCKSYGVYENEKFKTLQAHVNNMLKGVQEGYIYKLKICSSHFPMNVSISGNKFVVKNLLGEKIPREIEIKAGAKVEVKGDVIEVTGVDKDLVSQAAADIEKSTKITNRDRRIFQDGIYITHKDGKAI